MLVTSVMFLRITLRGGAGPDMPGTGPGGGITDIIVIISSMIIMLGIIMVTFNLDLILARIR